MAGFALFSTAMYRCLEIFIAQNYHTVRAISFVFTVIAAFVFYTAALLPSVDPVLSLPKHTHEMASLGLGFTVASSIGALAHSTLRETPKKSA